MMEPEADLPNPALDLAHYQTLRQRIRSVHDGVLKLATAADYTGAARQLGLLNGRCARLITAALIRAGYAGRVAFEG